MSEAPQSSDQLMQSRPKPITINTNSISQASPLVNQSHQPPRHQPTSDTHVGVAVDATFSLAKTALVNENIAHNASNNNSYQPPQQETYSGSAMNNGAGINQMQRERSFVRGAGQNMQNANKRRSLAMQQQQQQQQIRGKPALEIYRPPSNNHIRMDSNNAQNRLNVHAQEFTMSRNDLQTSKSIHSFHQHHQSLQQSKSNSNMHHPSGTGLGMHLPLSRMQQPRPILAYNQMQVPVSPIQGHLPLVASPSSGNILQQQHRVKFAPEPVVHHAVNQAQALAQNKQANPYLVPTPLQRSKSLTSADNLITRSMAGMSLAADTGDVGTFSAEVQAAIDKALVDPNQLPARMLMELASHIMERSVEGRRYALPISRLCIQIIAKEQKETFLEAILNTCRQWYNERDKVLGAPPNSKVPVRPRFTAFMSFLTEMFCQLKRRQLQLRTQCDGAPPPLVLLTLLEKCCEECVKPPVRSLSEIECLFFVLTCIGRDLEMHLPLQLEALLTKVRDAFLTSSAAAPAIRRTLLQLIELQASHWQLPGNTVLYYYPTQRQAMGANN